MRFDIKVCQFIDCAERCSFYLLCASCCGASPLTLLQGLLQVEKSNEYQKNGDILDLKMLEKCFIIWMRSLRLDY